jgi:hypothetical protein
MQQVTDSGLDLGVTFHGIDVAAQGHEWIVVAALVIGAIVAFAKQGWLSFWIANHLPPATRPYLAMVLGVLGLSSAELAAHVPLVRALIDGLLAGITAMAGHQLVVEGARGGKEIVSERPTPAPRGQPPFLGAILIAFGVGIATTSCAVEKAILHGAQDVCQKLEVQPEQEWVLFSCLVVDEVGNIVSEYTARVPAARAGQFASSRKPR